jgi:hypothetical protein
MLPVSIQTLLATIKQNRQQPQQFQIALGLGSAGGNKTKKFLLFIIPALIIVITSAGTAKTTEEGTGKGKKLLFQAKLKRLLFICLSFKSVSVVVLHSFFLVLRTYLSVVVARLDGRIGFFPVKAELILF